MLIAAITLAFAPCLPPPAARVTCVVDGDTVWIAGEKIRLLDIDAPEMRGDCARERRLAIAARDRLVAVLNARPFTIQREGKDRYGRTLARLGDAGAVLLREGLAHRWPDREGWCSGR